MTTSRYSSVEIGAISALTTITAGIGAGASASLRGGSIVESASIVGIGTGLFTAGAAFFAPKRQEAKPSFSKAVPGIAIMELVGTTIGYVGAKLFINAATSTAPFIDVTLGIPVSLGMLYCLVTLGDYYRQNTPVSTLRPHSR